jgi:hypothetical protein
MARLGVGRALETDAGGLVRMGHARDIERRVLLQLARTRDWEHLSETEVHAAAKGIGSGSIMERAEALAGEECDCVDAVAEVRALEERLREVARADALVGHAARVLRALRLALANAAEPVGPRKKGPHRAMLERLSREAWRYLQTSRPSWKGQDAAVAGIDTSDAPLGRWSYLTVQELEEWADDDGVIAGMLAEAMNLPWRDGATRPYRPGQGARRVADSLAPFVAFNGIGVVGDAHRDATPNELRALVAQRLAQLGEKERGQPRAILRAALEALGSNATLFRAADKRASRDRRRKAPTR